ncbi:MAG TPA: CRTAC1 family protein [Tepidisphaeraceae bacterium]|nr:CRTAC1 family protein [Tepidisphaeraceae bacterium]
MGCSREDEKAEKPAGAAPSGRAGKAGWGPAGTGALFTEITGAVGLDDKPPPWPDGMFVVPELTPGGVALFDYDGDGRLDILAVCHPPPSVDQFSKSRPNRLFRQKEDGTFVEVKGAAGLEGKGFHNAAAIGDVNNDGLADVYICNYGGPDEFFLSKGGGNFVDATAKAGFDKGPSSPANWSSTAAFFDYDGDGFLDLMVVHFATFVNSKCYAAGTSGGGIPENKRERDYCAPHTFTGQLATLWHNNRDGTFSDVTKQAGIVAAARGWGVIGADLTGDGLADILQANDEEPNQLWVNQGNGTFADEAVIRGCAFNASGGVEANMGIAVGDLYGRGMIDFLITHLNGETNTLFRSNGDGTFTDVTAGAGMAIVDRPFTGWGAGFFDCDNDGEMDIAVVNGRVARRRGLGTEELGPHWSRYAEPNLLFMSDGKGAFADASDRAGAFGSKPEVHRGLAFGDLRNRGAIDMVVSNVDNTVRVYRNDAAMKGGHWLQVLPMIGKREALGAKVIVSGGGRTRLGLCLRAYSYISSNDPRVHFGLGKTEKVDSLEVQWPSGMPKREKFEVGGVDRGIVVEQGKGKAI